MPLRAEWPRRSDLLAVPECYPDENILFVSVVNQVTHHEPNHLRLIVADPNAHSKQVNACQCHDDVEQDSDQDGDGNGHAESDRNALLQQDRQRDNDCDNHAKPHAQSDPDAHDDLDPVARDNIRDE